jgi:hypothetical protein
MAQTSAQRAAAKAARDAAANAVESATALDIASAVESEDISKAQRVYAEVTPRVATDSGALACVQRERRVDDSLGEYMLAIVRINPRDKSESVQRYPIAQVQQAISALGASGVTLFRMPETTKAPA